MSDSIELFDPEGFFPSDLRPPTLPLNPEKPGESTKKRLQYIKVPINVLPLNQ